MRVTITGADPRLVLEVGECGAPALLLEWLAYWQDRHGHAVRWFVTPYGVTESRTIL